MRNAIIASMAALLAIGAIVALTSCKLDPSKLPPCSDKAVWPDPCAAGPRDAGTDG